MKTFAASLLMLCVASTVAYADGLDLSSPSEAEVDALEHGAHRRVKGEVLTMIGLVHLAAGMALGITSVVERGHEGGLGGTAINIASAMMTVAGIGYSAGGIPLWVTGTREEARAKASLSASAGGLMLRF